VGKAGAEGARVGAPQAPRGVGCGEGVSPSHRGGSEEGQWQCPSPENFFISTLK